MTVLLNENLFGTKNLNLIIKLSHILASSKKGLMIKQSQTGMYLNSTEGGLLYAGLLNGSVCLVLILIAVNNTCIVQSH